MDKWKPLNPTPKHAASSSISDPSSSSSSAANDARIAALYAPPAQSTRHAPPAKPHPPAAHVAKRRSFLPAWAQSAPSSSQYASVAGGASQDKAGANGKGAAIDEEDELVGSFPLAVHQAIAKILPVEDLVRYMATCRPLARLVASEEIWLTRVKAAQWQDIQSIPVKHTTSAPQPSPPPSNIKAPQSLQQGASDDWGDFASPAEASMPKPYSSTSPNEDDSFGEYSGGSLANGTASLQAPMKPGRPGGAKSLFSFRAETSLPSCAKIEAYQVLKSYKECLRPFADSVAAGTSNIEESLIFLGPDASSSAWGAREQAALLGNLIRCSLPYPEGAALFDAKCSKKSADLVGQDDGVNGDGSIREQSLGAGLLQAASVLTSNLLSMFKASSDKRSDALRAASHGASGTDAAVARAEGDMRIFAVSLWDLGQQSARLKALLRKDGEKAEGWLLDGAAGGDEETSEENEAPGSEAKAAWLKTRQASLLPLSLSSNSRGQADYRDIFIFASPDAPPTLNFTPMDSVMSQLVTNFREEGEMIASIFPPEQGVLLAWARIVLSELITTYIRPLLDHANSHSVHLYLRCCAASFAQSLKLSEAIRSVTPPTRLPAPTLLNKSDATSSNTVDSEVNAQESADWRRRFESFYTADLCNDVVYEAWADIVEEYLIAEREWVKTEMSAVGDKWEEDLANEASASRVDAAFLTAQNPAAVKRSVLTGFKDVLLLPVTVVPRTAVHVGGAAFRTVGKGVSYVNPLNWQGNASSAAAQASTGAGAGASSSSLQEPISAKRSGGGTGGFFSPGLGRTHDSGSKGNVGQGYIDFSHGGTDGSSTAFYGDEEDEEDEADYKGDFDANVGGFDGVDIEDEWNEEVRAWKEVANKASQTSSEQRQQQKRATSSSRDAKKRSTAGSAAMRPSTPISRPNSAVAASASQDGNLARRALGATPGTPTGSSRSATPTSAQQERPTPASLQRMQLLLSLDTALQMIHLNRDSIKRIETFATAAAGAAATTTATRDGATTEARQGEAGRPRASSSAAAKASSSGSKLRVVTIKKEIEEVASSFLRCLGERHVAPGFAKATSQVRAWDPSSATTAVDDEKATAEQQHVEPLVHFFELVHVGDTIAQMVQVYFDQELSRHIDKDDFLNPVVRDKKRFESSLDESVATGLNAGVDLLMSQAEHIIATRQEAGDFYPELEATKGKGEKEKDMDLGHPTRACAEALACLTTHCKLLVGCADKSILEVFWQEIGLRLHSILCKHLKRQIISLQGGFKIIDDLNAYHHFVATQLRQPSLLPYFEALQALGSLYIVEEPRELAHLVRDAGSLTRGTLGPDDVYEFLQARCDFKRIERDVDREMYGFKVKEDCTVM